MNKEREVLQEHKVALDSQDQQVHLVNQDLQDNQESLVHLDHLEPLVKEDQQVPVDQRADLLGQLDQLDLGVKPVREENQEILVD